MDPSPVLDHAPVGRQHAGLLTILHAIAVPNGLGPICAGSIAPGCFASVGKYKARPGMLAVRGRSMGRPRTSRKGRIWKPGIISGTVQVFLGIRASLGHAPPAQQRRKSLEETRERVRGWCPARSSKPLRG